MKDLCKSDDFYTALRTAIDNLKTASDNQAPDIEVGAAIAHEQWDGWMKYMFGRCKTAEDGSVSIPGDLVERWTRQMNTAYADLPEEEKASDRVEAQKYMDWLL